MRSQNRSCRSRVRRCAGRLQPDNDQTKPYIPWCDFANQLNLRYSVTLGQALEEEALSVHPFASHFSAAPHFAGQLPPLLEYLGTQIDDRRLTSDDRSGDQSSIIIVSRQAARLAEVWSEKHSSLAASTDMDDPPQGQLNFVVGALPEGFIFKNEEVRRQNEEKNAVGKSPFFILPSSFSILTDAEIFGHVRPEGMVRGRARKSAPERAFADWKPGDAVVHEDYGIGIFREIGRASCRERV